MAGTPAQNGNSAAGNSDFSRKAMELAKGLWGTPRASDGEKGGPNQSFGAGGTPLPAQAASWPTPNSRDYKNPSDPNGERAKRKAEQGWTTDLNDFAVQNCSTPNARDYKGRTADSATRADGKSRMDQLDCRAEQGFTHPDQVTETHGLTSSEWRQNSRRLFRSAMSNVPATTLRRWLRAGSWRKRRLNVAFVEWLMNWPRGHAVSGFLEMASSQSALDTPYGNFSACTDSSLSILKEETDGDQALRTVRGPIQSARAKPTESVLQQEVQRCVSKGEVSKAIQKREDQREEYSGAPPDYGAPFGATPQNAGACASPEWDQNRQSHREFGTDLRGGSWPLTPPSNQSADNRMCNLQNGIHAAQDKARKNQDVLPPMQGRVCPHPAVGFLTWRQQMRSALCSMPTASGPWIWKPPVETAAPTQMELF
jgi:hypothetical protein